MSDSIQHFNQAAAEWDAKPTRVKVAESLSQAISAAIVLHNQMDVLDYGCGTGLVSLPLLSRIKSLTGMDTSAGMLEQFTAKIRQTQCSNCRSVLLVPEQSNLGAGVFDLIISTMAFHHIPEPLAVLGQMHRALRDQGQIVICDLDREDGTFHEHNNGIFHHGFERDQFGQYLLTAGFRNIGFRTAYTVRRDSGREYPIFLAHAVRS
ncbi:MAG: class I SAM-dependent methyltransferase [Leptospiraceae bacterium]|nr:class I SAM-dependent methyltransferase [Leptospiraceae bacterium]